MPVPALVLNCINAVLRDGRVLDLLIIFLDIILVVISYETTLATEQLSAEDTHDALLSPSIPPSRPPSTPLSTALNDTNKHAHEPTYVLDLRLSTIVNRLRNPAPPPPPPELLPLPNLTSLSARIQLLTQARNRLQQLRGRAAEQNGRDGPNARRGRNRPETNENEDEDETRNRERDSGPQRLPGTLDVHDGN